MANNYGETFQRLSHVLDATSEKFLPPAIAAMAIGEGENILQHDSRDGSFTKKYLAPIVEKKHGKIYSLEKSYTMHHHGRKHHGHSTIIHLNKDLLDGDLQDSFGGDKIQKASSFYILSFASDYRASLKRMYEILEKDGKVCLVFASKLDLYIRFIKHAREDPEWSEFSKKLAIPDWVEAELKGDDYRKIITDAVTSAGFSIEKIEFEKAPLMFNSKQAAVGKCLYYVLLSFCTSSR